MIEIAIIDDERPEHARIMECLTFFTQKEAISFSTHDFYDASSFLMGFEPIYDIILLDIEMPDMSGLEAAREIRKTDQNVILLFVTNMAQYAVNGYEVDALDFIVKPVDKYSFALKLGRAVSRTAKRAENAVLLKTGGDIISIRSSTIRYLEVEGHYVTYHTAEGDYQEYATLKRARERIKSRFFVPCSRYYLINLRYVDSIQGDFVLIGRDRLLISRPHKRGFLAAYADFIGGGTGNEP